MEGVEEETPRLKGVVIITLPPYDNPSLGKTITAFALTADPQPHEVSLPPPIPQTPVQSPHVHVQVLGQFSLKRLVLGSPLTSFGLLCLSLIVLFSWVSVNREVLFELREIDRDRDHESSSTIVFPLYSKRGGRGNSINDFEIKLGTFKDIVKKVARTKSATSTSKIDSTTILPLKGNIYPDGLYYTHMLLGNPPRPYFLDVDTGSDLTWIQCDAPCTSCTKGPHPFYKPRIQNLIDSKDSYCVEVQMSQVTKCETCDQCDYEIEYADQSSSIGVLAKDDFQLMSSNGSMLRPNFIFGCAYDQQGSLLNSLAKADGILGLGRGKISIASQLATSSNVKNVVAHCLASDAGGGYALLGNDFVPHNKMTWVPMVHSPLTNSYRAELTKVIYGGKQLNIGDRADGLRALVFDSGSSYTYIMEQAYNDLIAELKDASSESLILDASDDTLPLCWRANFPVRSVLEINHFFKPLNIQFGSKRWFGSTKLQIPPEGYLVISNKGNICLGILEGSNMHYGSDLILGDISLRGRLFVFDNVNDKIGWISSDCTKPQRLDTPQLV